eukprot:c46754_g1_i1.p1 GENE.c46754_g1_i1~~c46754_g1_i1.p1  ORF type:complete len:371 (+),score=100.47 c46754_g1_i1:38-1114(+)
MTTESQTSDAPTFERTIRVAFIGNSFTYFNDMPNMLEQLFATSPIPTKLEHEQVTPGGQNFTGHSEDEKVQELLNPEKHFDYIVLQDNSNVPGGGASGKKRVESINILKSVFAPKLQQCGAKPLLYSSWGHKNGTKYDSYRKDYFDFHSMNRLTEQGYELYAKTLEESGVNCQIVPANKAFWLVYKNVHQEVQRCEPPRYEEAKSRYSQILEAHLLTHPAPEKKEKKEKALKGEKADTADKEDKSEKKDKGEKEESAPTLPSYPDPVCEAGRTMFSRLFMPDDFHPTKLGSYLIALVFYAQLTGESPRGLSWRPPAECNEFDCKMTTKFGESFQPEEVSEEDAVYLQDVAHRAVFGDK